MTFMILESSANNNIDDEDIELGNHLHIHVSERAEALRHFPVGCLSALGGF